MAGDLASKSRGTCSGCNKNVKKLKSGKAAKHDYKMAGVLTTTCPGSGKPTKSLYSSGR